MRDEGCGGLEAVVAVVRDGVVCVYSILIIGSRRGSAGRVCRSISDYLVSKEIDGPTVMRNECNWRSCRLYNYC